MGGSGSTPTESRSWKFLEFFSSLEVINFVVGPGAPNFVFVYYGAVIIMIIHMRFKVAVLNLEINNGKISNLNGPKPDCFSLCPSQLR